MKLAVCIKQVPGTTQVEVDPVTGTLKRDGVESKLKPYALYALATALRLKEQLAAEITALTMGPPQAEEILREAYMMGVDDAVLVSDRKFAGADVLATSYAISQALRAAGPFDLIICGRQTTDGDTAQVGAELAEFLTVWEHQCLPKADIKFLSRTLMTTAEIQRYFWKEFRHFPLESRVQEVRKVLKNVSRPSLPSMPQCIWKKHPAN